MSLSDKTKKWLKANCDISLKGKTVLVTGSNSGIGFKTAETAVYLGADVILACRNVDKASKARDDLLRDYPDACVRVMLIDMASFKSIYAFVSELKNNQMDIYAFINNAAAFHHPGCRTADGFDLVIGTNYTGIYYLSELVLPYLASLPHEVLYINTVSVVVKAAGPIDYKDFYCMGKSHNLAVYARSKLCLSKYTYALAKRMKGSSVRVLMNQPGIAITPLGLDAFGKWLTRLSRIVPTPFNSPEKSSLSFAYILSHDVPDGSLVGPHVALDCFGYPRVNRLPDKAKTGADELILFTEKEIVKAKPDINLDLAGG